MLRTARWPLLVAVLVGGTALGRWSATPDVQGQSPPAAIPSELTSYRDVVKQVLPAVVSIDAKAKKARRANAPRGGARPRQDLPDNVPEEFRRFFEQMQPPNGEELPPNPNLGSGSGFIIDPAGVVVTNWHVVEGADEVVVSLTDGRKFTSADIKSDQGSDLAVVRFKADGKLPALTFGDSTQMEIGDRVLAVGAPFGLAGSVTQGIISAKARDLRSSPYGEDFLQTDAAINPGNSGGPLVNLAGQVIGITSAIKTRSGGFQGVGLAISSSVAKKVVQQLLKEGVVRRGYLGIQMSTEVAPEVAQRLGLTDGGVVVASVRENSPAAKAGLKPEDAIVSINGKRVRDNRELQRTVSDLPLNQPVALEVLREGRPTTLTLTIEEEPKGYRTAGLQARPRGGRNSVESEAVTVPRAGLELADLTADRAEQLGLSVKGGALIVRVEPNGPAAEAGLSRGLVVTKVDKKAVTTAEAAKAALEAADPEKGALVQAQSPQGGTEYVIVKVAK